MAQHDYVLENQSGALFRQDLNSALNAIATNNMAAMAPTTTYAGMWWLDTSTNPATLRIRNNDNSAWISCGNLTELGYLAGVTSGIQMQLNAKAPLSSPGFTGTPTAPHPTSGDRTNKIATMAMFTNEFVASFAANGYQKLPSGLIIQWGSYVAAAGDGTARTFPIAFPGSCLDVQRNFISASDVGGVLSYSSVTDTGFVPKWNCFACGANPTVAHHWFAIGY